LAQAVAANRFEQGLVAGAASLHAVRKTVRGLTALCGAGAIITVVAGRFDPSWTEACPECITEASGPSPSE